MPREVKFFKQDTLIQCSLCRERVVACFHELKCANIDILNSSTSKIIEKWQKFRTFEKFNHIQGP